MPDDRVVHCWEPLEDADGSDLGATCMLLDGHDGPHEFTPDSDITVSFTAGEDA